MVTEVVAVNDLIGSAHRSSYYQPVIIPESRLRKSSSEEAKTDGNDYQCPYCNNGTTYAGIFVARETCIVESR